MLDVLSALDETFLELEELEPGALMNIGGILVFDALPEGGAPAFSELRASRLERLGQLPRYTQRLSSTRMGRFKTNNHPPATRPTSHAPSPPRSTITTQTPRRNKPSAQAHPGTPQPLPRPPPDHSASHRLGSPAATKRQ
jgi:hypothetical protein